MNPSSRGALAVLLRRTIVVSLFAFVPLSMARTLPNSEGRASAQTRRARASHSGRRSGHHRSQARSRSREERYRAQVRRWHRRVPRPEREAWEQQEPPPLVFRPIQYTGRYALLPDGDGNFDPEQLFVARKAFTHRTGLTADIHPRLMDLAYRVVREFRVPYLWLISGFRETRSSSRHNQGRAMDIVAPGVPNPRLARFARRQGFVGVGEYPRSGFVHVDVRERSYYWVDRSAPGQRSRERRVRRTEAWRNDARASERGEQPVPDLEGMGDTPTGGSLSDTEVAMDSDDSDSSTVGE